MFITMVGAKMSNAVTQISSQSPHICKATSNQFKDLTIYHGII